jgi:hypothetical protein
MELVLKMAGSIIDAEKLQNEQFIIRDWIIFINGVRTTIVFQKTWKEIKNTVNTFNAIGKLQGLNYTFKECVVKDIEVKG